MRCSNASSLAILLVLLLSVSTTRLSAQPKAFSIPQDPVATYFQIVVTPAMSGTALNERDVANFYHTLISFYSQAKVAEDQFIAHWQNVAQQVNGAKFWGAVLTGSKYSLTYDIGEPVYNDAKDQARFKVTLTLTDSRLFHSTQENRIFFVHVIKEEGAWKIVLNDDLVAEMQKLPTKQTAKRYAIGREVIQNGLRFAVLTLAIEKDATIVGVVLENQSDEGADLFNALSAATLRDGLGNIYAARMLQTTLPTDVGSRKTVTGTLVFTAIPPNTKRVILTVPDAKIGTDTVTFSIEFDLAV
jgi:hypothetical protein